tara:strand:+ start:1447 stop:1692 length:246 start_codon:yes stop_codon:yes gene_type:complete
VAFARTPKSAQARGKIFEHWAHALAYLPISDFRFSLPMMNRIVDGKGIGIPKTQNRLTSYFAESLPKGHCRLRILLPKKVV